MGWPYLFIWLYCILPGNEIWFKPILIRKKIKTASYLHRGATTLVPLLPSDPGGVKRELPVQDLPNANIKAKKLLFQHLEKQILKEKVTV